MLKLVAATGGGRILIDHEGSGACHPLHPTLPSQDVDGAPYSTDSQMLERLITTCNPGATAMYGYAPEEMIGHHISELIPADRAGELTPIPERTVRGERVAWPRWPGCPRRGGAARGRRRCRR